MGSRILSRSFHVEQWAGEDGEDGEGESIVGDNPDVSMESQRSMDVDQPRAESAPQISPDVAEQVEREDGESDSDDDDQENVEDVAMVPMADMLNARYGGENVSGLSHI